MVDWAMADWDMTSEGAPTSKAAAMARLGIFDIVGDSFFVPSVKRRKETRVP
jgi:hypothetical protein